MNLQTPVGCGQTFRDISTSASGAMCTVPEMLFLPVTRLFLFEGTAARQLLPEDWMSLPSTLPQTSVGRTQIEETGETESTGAAIMELRRISGLTWDQLTRLFGVTRRSLHFWASGKLLNASNEERLRRVLAVIRRVDRGSGVKNRVMLLEDQKGVVPFDLLARGEYEAFASLIGASHCPRRRKLSLLSPEEYDARKPQSPEELTGAMQNRVHIEKGRLISSTPIRRKRQE
jgi:hypothetical protein